MIKMFRSSFTQNLVEHFVLKKCYTKLSLTSCSVDLFLVVNTDHISMVTWNKEHINFGSKHIAQAEKLWMVTGRDIE